MKTVFAGTPEFAAVALEALIRGGHRIELVLTQPDRPAGRGMKLQPSAVKKLAQAHGLPVAQPVSLRLDGQHGDEAQKVHDRIAQIAPDIMVVVAYGLILPKAFLSLPKYGCLNIHASLLPRWRGAAPIQRAIEAGDSQTGISIMQMEEGLDTGPVLVSASLPITPDCTASVLHDRLAEMGGKLILSALQDIEQGRARFTAQQDNDAIYAAKIRKEEAVLDFSQSCTAVANKIRAFNPFPGCLARYGDIPVKIWNATATDCPAGLKAGKILSADENGIVVACGQGAIRIHELQKPGGKRLAAQEFIKGFSLENGHFD